MKINLKNIAVLALSALMCISATTVSAEEFHHGDVNYDSIVDASDASLILVNYAAASTNQPLVFNEIQLELADTNGDGLADASDASMVLMYYSYASTSVGNIMTPEEYYSNTLTKPPTEAPTEPPTEAPTEQPTEPETTMTTTTTAKPPAQAFIAVPDSSVLYVGNEFKLDIVSPDGVIPQIYWVESSDYSIAQCSDDSTVKLYKEGTVTLTAHCTGNIDIPITITISSNSLSTSQTTTTNKTTATTTTKTTIKTTATTTTKTTTKTTATTTTTKTTTTTTTESPTEAPTDPPAQPSIYNYVLNTSTMKAHLPDCRDVDKIVAENRLNYYGNVEELKSMEYSPCGHCHPWPKDDT